MNARDLLIGLAVSLILHGLLLYGIQQVLPESAHVHFERGRDAVALTLQSAAPAPDTTAADTPSPTEPEDAQSEDPTPAPVPDDPEPVDTERDIPDEEEADAEEAEEEAADQEDPPEEAEEDADVEPAPEDYAAELDKGIDTPARVSGDHYPEYPAISRRRGEEGQVILDVEVLPSGRAGSVRVVSSSGHKRLDEAALRAVKEANFQPAERRGEPVRSTNQWSFIFRLDD